MKRETLQKLGLLGVGIALALLVAEGGARLLLPAPARVMIAESGSPDPKPMAGEGKAQRSLARHPEEGFVYVETPTGRRLRPNAHAVIERHSLSKRRIEIDTNSHGYRDHEVGPKTGTRLLFLGDSITFGDYLPEEETFVRLVEGIATQDAADWETINAGVGAVSLENELAILLETGLSLKPDAVIVCYYLNDFQESPGVSIQRIPAPFDRSRLISHLWLALPRLLYLATGHGSKLLRATAEGIDTEAWRGEFEAILASRHGRQSEDQKEFFQKVLKAFHDWGGAWSPRSWSIVRPCLQEMQDLAGRRGFQLFIVAFPVRAQVEAGFVEDYPQQQLKRIAAELGVPFLDILPVLRAANVPSAGPLFYDQCHHTPEANRIIARAIYDFLQKHVGNETRRAERAAAAN